MDYNRIISLLIALIYIIVAFIAGSGQSVFYIAVFLVFVLALIWFSDEMGSYIGFVGRGPPITKETPGCIVRFMGWLFLLLPAVVYLIMLLRNKATNP